MGGKDAGGTIGLFLLPQELLCELLAERLSAADLINLDCALMVSRKQHAQMLQLFRHDSMVLRSAQHGTLEDPRLQQWLLHRSVGVEALSLTPAQSREPLLRFLRVRGSHLLHLEMSGGALLLGRAEALWGLINEPYSPDVLDVLQLDSHPSPSPSSIRMVDLALTQMQAQSWGTSDTLGILGGDSNEQAMAKLALQPLLLGMGGIGMGDIGMRGTGGIEGIEGIGVGGIGGIGGMGGIGGGGVLEGGTATSSLSTLIEALESCPQLQTLRVTTAEAVRDAFCESVAALCPQLQEVQVRALRCHITDKALALLASCHLRTFRCAGARGVTSRGLAMLAGAQLRCVDLSECRGLTDEGVRALTGCGGLLEVDLSGNPALTDAAAEVLALGCPGLRVLRLSHNPLLTDAAVLSVSRCPLEVLGLACVGKVTDASVVVLAESCPDLLELDVDRNLHVSDLTLHALARHCPRLQSLNLTFNPRVTEAAVVGLVRGCALRRLVVDDCNSIDQDCRDFLSERGIEHF